MNSLDTTDAPELRKGHMYRALVRDAFLQVLDNTVFKVLLALVLLMVALTFVIGFRQDGIHLLFGVVVYDYQTFLGSFGWMFGAIGGDNTNETVVRTIQNLFTTTISGTFGALFAVVATSFFLPRMLERGAADTLFSKPVSRGVLVLSRYVASLIFVSLLTLVLVLGMYLGFAVSSGYTDIEFIWSAPMLIYLFSILSAFSTFWGAMTRSSVATLLLTVLSWWGCVGVHAGWLFWDYVEVIEDSGAFDETDDEDDSLAEDADEKVETDEEPSVFLGALKTGLDVAHLVLPKTSDASDLTDLTRKTLHRETRTLLGGIGLRHYVLQVYEQADGTIIIASPGPQGNEATYPDGRGTQLEVQGTRPVFVRISEEGDLEAWSVLTREDREAQREYRRAVEDGEVVDEAWPPAYASPAEIVKPDEVDFGMEDPATFKSRRFTWDQSELGYSPVFSLISSLLSSGLLILLAIWRVRRIDF